MASPGEMRKEQLKRYNGSLLDQTSSTPKSPGQSRFKFRKECVFLASCSSEDMEEVKNLLDEGIDINTANVDGLTALHQACIYERLDLVKFLVKHSADVNVKDNDGWTPLHAACSNDFVDIARFLINNGARLDAVSFDGELPIDVADSEEMHGLIMEAMRKSGTDDGHARKQEEERMLGDAQNWLRHGNYKNIIIVDTRSGATPLHVAASRGYIQVMKVLLQAGANVNAKDYDGWTPIHAAAHWGQKEACLVLVDNLCDLDIRNNCGLLPQDVADPELGDLLEELKKNQVKLSNDPALRRKTYTSKRRSSVSRMSFDQKQMMARRSRDEEKVGLEMLIAKRTGRNSTDMGIEEENEEDAMDEEAAEEEVAENGGQTANWGGDDRADSGIGSANVRQKKLVRAEEASEEDVTEDIMNFQDQSDGGDDVYDDDEGDDKAFVEEQKVEETPPMSDIVKEQNRINNSKSAEANKESDSGKSLPVPESQASGVTRRYSPQKTGNLTVNLEHEVSMRSTVRNSAPPTGHLLSSGTAAALRAIAVSHRWSFEDSKKDEDKEVSRKTRSINARKNRRSTQAADRHTEEESQGMQTLDGDLRTENATKEATARVDEAAVATNEHSKKELSESQSLNPPVGQQVLTLYRRSTPRDMGIVEDEIASKMAASARARRKREDRESARPQRQEMPQLPVERNRPSSGGAMVSGLVQPSVSPLLSHQSSLQMGSDHHPSTSRENKAGVDYKKLYEREQSVSELLSQQVRNLQREAKDLKAELEHANEVNKNYAKLTSEAGLSQMEKRTLERRVAELEDEVKNAETLKTENQRLKEENAALIRVISKLSK